MDHVLIILLAVAATTLPFWLGQRYGVIALVSPMHLLGYFCAAGFLIKAVVYALVPQWAFFRRFGDVADAGLTGAIFLTVFVLLMCLGYRCALRSTDLPFDPQATRIIAAATGRQHGLFFAAFVIAALTLFLMMRARGVSGLSLDLLASLNKDKQINVDANGNGATLAGIKSLFVVPKCAFVLLFVKGIATGNRTALTQAGLLAALLVAIGLVSGDRFELLELFVYGCIGYVIVGGAIGVRAAIVAAVAACAVLLVSAYMTVLRGHDAGLLHQIVGSTYFLDFNAAVMVTQRVTPAMMLWGDSYGWWSFGWYPRAVWPDKPAIDLGVYFKSVVMGQKTGGAFNVTGPGEAFINFGWAGVAVGFVLGWIYRRTEVALLATRNVLRGTTFILYPLLFYPFVQATMQSSFSAFVVGAVAQSVLIMVVLSLVVTRFRPMDTLQGAAPCATA